MLEKYHKNVLLVWQSYFSRMIMITIYIATAINKQPIKLWFWFYQSNINNLLRKYERHKTHPFFSALLLFKKMSLDRAEHKKKKQEFKQRWQLILAAD